MPALTHSSETESVVGIQFAVFSPDEIISRSVVEITSHSTQDGKVGGLADPRLGVLENGKICRTCQQNNHNCPGHFGHYKLARPIYFYQFFNLIVKILRCTCIKCAKLLINKDKAKTLRRAQGENRWNVVFAACQEINRCGESTEDGCGARQPDKYVVEDICRIVAEWKNMSPTDNESEGGNIRRFLEPEYVYRLLRRISDEDVDFMGFSRLWCRPDWMMCSVLPIPPPHVRPSVLQDNNQKSEDDLTQKLVDIIKTNIKLADLMEKGSKAVSEWTVLLQYHLATYVDNNIPGVAQSAQRSGRPLKSLQQRLGTKEGRIRNNLQGKRVEFSARSVITPDPNISVGELGVPFKIAMNLTFPETVRADNLDHLYALVRNGPSVYPGARSIKRLDGRTVSLKHVDTSTIVLYEGDEVNRHMLDGDPVLFNRQPSLHRMSMMCHKVRVLPGSTFRLNVSVTKPYNADFDGDEMNLHASQSVETSVELREIPAVAKQMIGPRQSKALIGIVQDTLVGVNRLTRPTEFFSLREYMNLLIHAKRWNGVIPEPAQTSPIPRWSGRQVVSALLPSIHLSMPNKAWKKEDGPKSDNFVVIRDGVIEQGILDGDIFDKGLILVMFNDFGPDITVDFIDSLQAVVAAYLQNYGFSVGLSDLIADPATMLEIAAKSAESKNQLESLQLRVHMGLFENTTGRTNQEEFENLAFQALNKTTEAVGDIGIKALTSNNRMINMIKCGSKGKTINMAQMLSLLGQQAIEGKRVGYGFQDRTLPHFKRYDDGAEARGYIERSFVRGLKPSEFFFHAMTGREGLIDTAVKSVTGDTEISLVETATGRWFTTTIGDWVDGLMAAAPSTIQHSQPANLELLPTTGFAIWTADVHSRASVEPITAVTRHDPGDVLFHIVTSTGAAVTVSANKSLCIYGSDGILRECAPADVHVGDAVCVLSRGECVRAGYFTEEAFGVQRATITSIEQRAVTDPRMRLYDLTVPATLNFALASGLVVRDTADSGYMQRKLIKTMEDLMVFFDGSVRDSGGLVVQFAYGDDRTSATKIENQSLPLGKFSDSEIRARFTVQDVDAARAQAHLKRVFEDRDILVQKVWNGHVESSVQSAVNLQRLIADAIVNMNLQQQQNDSPVSGGHVLDAIDSIIRRTNPHNRVWASLLRFYLNPSDLQQRFTEAAFDWLAEQIVVKHMKSWVVPGEMAGIIAAQSIGEPLTQLTLNSVDWETEIVIACDGQLMTPRIGEFIDNYIADCDPARIQHLPNEQLYVSLEGDGHDWKAVSCDADGRMQWTRLEAITKHPVVNEDGSDTILEVETESGCIVRATKARSFLRFEGGTLVATNGSDLKVGDLLPVANNLAMEELGVVTEMFGIPLTREFGNFCGKYVATGTNGGAMFGMCDDAFMATMFKTLPNWVIQAPDAFVEGFVSHSSSDSLLMARCAKSSHLDKFNDTILDKVKKITECSPKGGRVYDVTVEGTRNFMLRNKLVMRDTFHLSGFSSKAGMTRGVPRLKELLMVTQNPKASSLTIHLRPDLRNSQDEARRLAQDFEFTLLKDLVTTSRIYYDPRDASTLITEDVEWLRFFAEFEQTQENESPSPWIVRIELDREKMFAKNITIEDIVFTLRSAFEGQIPIAFTDHNASRLILRMRFLQPTAKKGAAAVDELDNIKQQQNKLLTQVLIRGLPGLRSVTFRKLEDEKESMYEKAAGSEKYEKVEQFVLDTLGSNLLDVMNHPSVDGLNVLSNHIHDVYENLGIEAARQVLFREIFTIFEQGEPVNQRHVALLCDAMCNKGRLMPADRYGVNKKKTGVLIKASFEQAEQLMIKAALFGELDSCTGVSANIMLGQAIRAGTSFTHVLLDEAAFLQYTREAPEPRTFDKLKRIPKLTEDEIKQILDRKDMQGCSTQDLTVSAVLPPADEQLVTSLITLPDIEINIVDDE